MNTLERRITADDIARRSAQPTSLLEDLYMFYRVDKKRDERMKLIKNLAWWALVVGAVVLSVISICAR